MEGKENMASGVRVIGAETPSNYQVAPKSDAPPQMTILPSMMTPTSSGVTRVIEKKKRGRPRKYGPDGPVGGPMSLGPSSSTASICSSGKRGKRGPSSSETKHSQKMEIESKGGAQYDGSHFTPHVIAVNAGEDVTAKIISFCQQGPRAICILSANGTVSNATLSHYDSSGCTMTYEGRFEIVNLCGSFAPTDREGTKYRAGGLSIALSSPSGQVVGGCAAGLLMAATPIQVEWLKVNISQGLSLASLEPRVSSASISLSLETRIIVGSFLPSAQPEHRPKKLKSHPPPLSAMPPLAPPADKDEACDGEGKSSPTPSPFGRDGWPNAHAHVVQHSRNSTDINIALPGGLQ